MYGSPTDPKIEKDVTAIERGYAAFQKKYVTKRSYLTDEKKLLAALKDYEKLEAMPNPLVYFRLFLDINGGHAEAEAASNRINQRLTKGVNKIIFFRLSLANVPKNKQKAFLVSKKLAGFNYFLERIFVMSKYNLTEPEEKIMNVKRLTSREKWIEGQEKLLGKQTINFKNKEMPIAEALSKVRELPTGDRRVLHKIIMERYKSLSDFAESEMNAIVTDKKINDELRGYAKPYSATILGYQNDEKAIESLVKTVTKHFKISHRYYKLKSKMLSLSKMSYADRGVSVGKTTKKVPFDEGVKLVQNAFSKLGKEYEEVFLSYLKNGQIDVFPKKGKKSGAYCWSNTNLPTYVFLNYTDTLDSVSTLAHEMGHAIHGEFSKVQSIIYQGHTISVAEVASTLFENFAFEEVLKTLSDTEKIIALNDRITDDIQTIFRQIALFNFEVEMHMTIRKKGAMPKEDIAALMNNHMQSYLGPTFKMNEEDGYFFVTWSHIRRFFYVYSYAYGQLISKALYKKYQQDPKYLKKIEQFLSAGETKSPENIFKDIGIDTSKPAFFEAGLKSIGDDISRLEKLIKNSKKVSKKK